MKILAKNLLEKGIKPRLLHCGFRLPMQLTKVLSELLPYTTVSVVKEEEKKVTLSIDFGEFVITYEFDFYTRPSGTHYIDNIKIIENE